MTARPNPVPASRAGRPSALRAGLVLGGGLAVAALLAPAPGGAAGPSCASPYEAGSFERPARRGVMPAVVCMDLQMAQDKLQAAGYSNLRSSDGAGLGRRQVYDRNWYVTEQSVAPGRRYPTESPVALTALKYGDPGAAKPYDRSKPAPVPRLGCFDLQEAQDTLQSAGFYQMRTSDASGHGRSAWADRNWTVVGQTPPGGRFSDKGAEVTLRVMKDAEARRRCG